MRIQQLSTSKQYLYEGLDYSNRKTMVLWESAGLQLKEAALTADQIQSLFAEIEKSATDAGGNRTALGIGKDAMSAVNKAWEDLKTKIQDSGPIKAVDQKYDDVVGKIEKGLGGPDNAVSQVIQKYRKFAKEHPIAQGLIYSALIAAAGISGAGLGGAAVLGLLKMTDKLLQGEKFSSAAYSGAKTGAMAYGASKIGDYVKGKMADKDAYDAMGDAQDLRGQLGAPDAAMAKDLAADQAFQDSMLNKFPPDKGYTFKASGDSLQVFDDSGRKVFTGDIPLKTMDMKTFADLTNNGQMATPGISSGSVSSDPMAGVTDTVAKRGNSGWDSMKANTNADGSPLTVDQINAAKASLRAGNATDMSTATDAGSTVASKAADVAVGAGSPPPVGAAFNSAYLQQVVDAEGKSGIRFKISPEDAQKALDWQDSNGGQLVQAASTAGKAASGYSKDYLEKVLSGDHPRPMISKEKAAALLKSMESVNRSGKRLSEGQIYLVFNRVCTVNNYMLSEGRLVEGPMDWAKGLAGKAIGKAKTVGHNLTTKVTADKLNSAWQKAGSPMDSEKLKAFLTQQGVSPEVVDTVYSSMKITDAPADQQGQAVDFEQVKAMIAKLPLDRKERLLKYIQKNSGSAAPAAPNRDAGDGRIEPTLA
jgi:hypothetical protein